jgi:type I restriction enzyme S subunit
MMFAQRVRPNELIDLLAAESYDPVLMKYCGYTKNAPKLSDFVTDKARLGVTGTIANAYVPEGTAAAIPYLTTKQVDGLYAHLDGCKYITAQADRKWSHCRVPEGSIVLNKSGNVGAASIVACAPYAYVNTVSDLINIRPRRLGTDGGGRVIDIGYLVVFLNSPYGQSQLQRLSGGAVFDHVSLFAVPEIRIHEPTPLAQQYIGDKVRQAERLRERAQRLRSLSTAAP